MSERDKNAAERWDQLSGIIHYTRMIADWEKDQARRFGLDRCRFILISQYKIKVLRARYNELL